MRYYSEAVLNRNNALKREKTMPRSPISKLKPLSLSNDKKEEPIEPTLDTSAIPQNRLINESSTKLESIITASIGKLKTLFTILLYLADLSEAEQVGSIQQLLTSRKQRAAVRTQLLARVEDNERLMEFAKALP
uniref:Predicted protein n=1 Tax=Hordeum vulgare subsp. vulgare TaxID=112509 RepID=F2DEY3_HORVV|nr:predicted protein [Hordeum vulgare subsp. vulgare]